MKVVLLFLKAANILPLWIDYINDKKYNTRWYTYHFYTHWSNKQKIVDIFDESGFTIFLKEKYGIRTKGDVIVAKIFMMFLREYEKNHIEDAIEIVKTYFNR